MHVTNLIAFPDHIILHIVCMLDAPSVVALERTCRTTRRVASSSEVWEPLCLSQGYDLEVLRSAKAVYGSRCSSDRNWLTGNYHCVHLESKTQVHDNSVFAVNLLPPSLASNGRARALTMSDECTALWDAVTGELLSTTDAPMLDVVLPHFASSACDFDFNEEYVVTVVEQAEVVVFNPEGVIVATGRGHTRPIDCLSVCGDLAVTGSKDRTLRVWGVPDATCRRIFTHDGAVLCAIFTYANQSDLKLKSEDSGGNGESSSASRGAAACRQRTLITGSSSGIVRLWDTCPWGASDALQMVDDYQPDAADIADTPHELHGHKHWVLCMNAIMPARRLVTVPLRARVSGRGGEVRVWCLRTRACLFTLAGHEPVLSVHMDGYRVICGTRFSSVSIYHFGEDAANVASALSCSNEAQTADGDAKVIVRLNSDVAGVVVVDVQVSCVRGGAGSVREAPPTEPYGDTSVCGFHCKAPQPAAPDSDPGSRISKCLEEESEEMGMEEEKTEEEEEEEEKDHARSIVEEETAEMLVSAMLQPKNWPSILRPSASAPNLRQLVHE
ncbi:hypothetical protein CYMTET_14786 [Cymbomonas tetramitiformis]|uniref:F-box domain-containing protein n=1 Tax=Cymbomonas tetramitiformis TaxID=36881 RepID=A0AAE0GFW5_9CHLO|nr:hypothetical protein CYMTET_14786 [Cymbomonas tetramitiformis]